MAAALVLGVACARAAFGVRTRAAAACRRRSGRCCSTTRSPAVARPSASRWPTKPARAGSSRSSSAPRGTSRSSCATPSPAAPTGWRWPAATARRPIVAAIAAELDLPYACIPAGTRNHFALDLGVDRDDVVGALDAFVDGGERRVDLAEVNGRVFVNNVSLGLYADAVQRSGYRDAKLRTILDTVPEVLGPEGTGLDLRWTGPGGHEHGSGAAILVSNNRYRLGRAVGSGTRPRIDDGLLGITVAGRPDRRRRTATGLQRPWREWTAPAFEVDADAPRARRHRRRGRRSCEPPLRFRIRPGVLRVRIAPPASRRLAVGDPARGLRAEPARAGPDRRRPRRRPSPQPTTRRRR